VEKTFERRGFAGCLSVNHVFLSARTEMEQEGETEGERGREGEGEGRGE
jgi:hypothetical protein